MVLSAAALMTRELWILFAGALQRLELAVADADGELRLGVVRREGDGALGVTDRDIAEAQLLDRLRGVAHLVPVLARNLHEQVHVLGIELLGREVILQRLLGLELRVIDIALRDQLLGGIGARGERSEQQDGPEPGTAEVRGTHPP